MNAIAPTITKGTKLYSLTRFDAAGFPDEVKVTRVEGDAVYVASGRVTLSEWTTDWHTALVAWQPPR